MMPPSVTEVMVCEVKCQLRSYCWGYTEDAEEQILLTFDLVRTPPVESIQMYLTGIRQREICAYRATHSAIALPFWSRDMYFRSYKIVSLTMVG